MLGDKEQTVIKQKTTVKEKYNVPTQNLNQNMDVPVATTNVPIT
jgi:hypothetical protein